jgi:hypothetical protein
MLKIQKHMKKSAMTPGYNATPVIVISFLSTTSAILGQIRKVPWGRHGHRQAGQERKGIPFLMAVLAGYFFND